MLARRIQRLVRGVAAPNLVVAQRVIDKMAAAAHEHLQDETGEAMVGLVTPAPLPNGVPTLYVLDTISPDASAVRQFHTFQQGDDRQDELIWWLQENWRIQREKAKQGSALARWLAGSTNKWDVPLSYLGDWHKQPGYMIQPSGGDLMTALDWISDPENNTTFLLAPIVTLNHPTTIDLPDGIGNFLLVPQDVESALRIDFWYIDQMTQMFIPIVPAVYPDEQLPELVPYPWHLTRESLAREEFGLLQDDGLALSVTIWSATGEVPLQVCLMVARRGADKLLIIVTPHDYPAHSPTIRVAPFVRMGPEDDMQAVFEKAWTQSSPVDLAYDVVKHPTLLAYVHEAEDKVGIVRAAASAAAPAPSPTPAPTEAPAPADPPASTEKEGAP